MANWYKIAGIILIVLGIVIIIGSPIMIITPGDETENHPWETDATAFYVGVGLGIVLIVVGIFLYYIGHKKEKGLVPAPKPPN